MPFFNQLSLMIESCRESPLLPEVLPISFGNRESHWFRNRRVRFPATIWKHLSTSKEYTVECSDTNIWWHCTIDESLTIKPYGTLNERDLNNLWIFFNVVTLIRYDQNYPRPLVKNTVCTIWLAYIATYIKWGLEHYTFLFLSHQW